MYVNDLCYLDGYRLQLWFSDGTTGTADLESEVRTFGPFASLIDMQLFRQAYVEGGTVSWPGAIDIAPERLYALAHGRPIPKTFEDVEANELAVSLSELRRFSETRQVDLAASLEITQGSVSRLEGAAADAKLATLRRYVNALGWDLEIVAVKGDKRLRLRGI